MAQLRVDYSDFSLQSTWYVSTGSNGNLTITSGPTTATKTVTFEYNLPADASVTRARVYSTWGSPLSGFAIRTVDGVNPTSTTDGYVDVSLDASASSISVQFKFKANGNTTNQGNRTGTTNVSNVYLLIDYTTGGSSGGGESGGGDSSKPSPPAKLYLAGLDGNFVNVKPGTIFDLSWDASTSQSVWGYIVYYSDNGGESYLQYGTTSSLSMEVAASDKNSIERIFRVRTICTDGSLSEYSSPISITTIAATSGSRIYRCENGTLVPYHLYRYENGQLVKYNIYYHNGSTLIKY